MAKLLCIGLLRLAPLPIFRHTPRPMKKKSPGKKSRITQHATRNSMRPFSSILVDGPERAAARAMLYPVGFTEEDFKKPIIGIASTWSNVTPCNMHIDKLALEAEKGTNAADGKAIVFNTITISDGISMGSEGMKYSLVSRVVIAESIETVVGCGGVGGYVAIGGWV
jgi:dihydroxy-acid dehydratase